MTVRAELSLQRLWPHPSPLPLSPVGRGVQFGVRHAPQVGSRYPKPSATHRLPTTPRPHGERGRGEGDKAAMSTQGAPSAIAAMPMARALSRPQRAVIRSRLGSTRSGQPWPTPRATRCLSTTPRPHGERGRGEGDKAAKSTQGAPPATAAMPMARVLSRAQRAGVRSRLPSARPGQPGPTPGATHRPSTTPRPSGERGRGEGDAQP